MSDTEVNVLDNLKAIQNRDKNSGNGNMPPGVELKINPGKSGQKKNISISESGQNVKRDAEGFPIGPDLGDIGADLGADGSSLDHLKVDNRLLKRDETGSKNVVQLWQSGEQFGVQIGSRFHEIPKQVYDLFLNVVELNKHLKTELTTAEEMVGKLKRS